MASQKILQQGAEAIILKKDDKVIKRRTKKSYRIKELDDKIRKRRTKSETKLLHKASKVIDVPRVIEVDEEAKEIVMDFIDGKKLSDNLDKFPLEKQKKVARLIGENVAKLHNSDIIHGDLTTSNMILKNKKVYFIDFGLGYNSQKIEDRAVDIHLLRQALESKHFQNWEILFKQVLKGYKKSKGYEKILERLKAVEKRGRYKK